MHTARTIRDKKEMRPITQGSTQILFLALTTGGLRKGVNRWIIRQSILHSRQMSNTGLSDARVLPWFPAAETNLGSDCLTLGKKFVSFLYLWHKIIGMVPISEDYL